MRRLVIVAPTYNESANINNFVAAIFSESKKIKNCETFLLISDSHSSDETPKLVRNLIKKNKHLVYLDVMKRGLGLGLIEGLNYAISKLKADFLITIEADLSNDPKKLGEIVRLLAKYELVIGSRYAHGGGIDNWSWWRKKLSLGANTVLKILAWSNVNEYTNLYRGFRKEVWMSIRGSLKNYDGWLFVPAFVFEALPLKFSIVEMPYTYFDRFGGTSKMNTLAYTKSLLWYALHYRLNKLWPIS
jgi:dolichol-phosphate mannosyltransferase